MTRPAASAHRSRSVDRLINFTDAVVAVAATLLALPLVDIPPPANGESIRTLLYDNAGPFIAFLFTFAVVAIMWSAHNRILNGIRDFDGTIFWLNTAWLAAIVLLPWISNMYGETQMLGSGSGGTGTGALYWGALALISMLGWWITGHLGRHPDLLAEPPGPASATARRNAARGPVFALYFLFIAVVSVIAPPVASWLPLGIIPLSIWLRPARSADPDHSTPATQEDS